MSFIAELKRRNVFKVAAAYVVVSWLALQVVDTLADPFHLPGWAGSLVGVLLLIGFPVAMILAWAYELTPEGVKKAEEVDKDQSITHVTGQKINTLIIGLMAIALGYFIWESRFSGDVPAQMPIPETVVEQTGEAGKPAQAEAEKTSISQASIAVLPFADLSQAKDQEYFTDGISEELLNLLAGVQNLKVTSRTSAFSFKGQNISIKEIAKKLGVAHVLEGSVRKDGDTIRITAQLIRASDDAHLWSSTYDRKLESIFAIQDEIANAIVDALMPYLGKQAKPRVKILQATNPEAHRLFLLARHLMRNKRFEESLRQAMDYLEQALETDENYAPAHAALAECWLLMDTYSTVSTTESLLKAKPYIDRALELDPALATAHAVSGFYYADKRNFEKAMKEYDRAIELNPAYSEVKIWKSFELDDQMHFRDALALRREVVAQDPMFALGLFNLSQSLRNFGLIEEMEGLLPSLMELDPARGERVVSYISSYKGQGQSTLAQSLNILGQAGTLPQLRRYLATMFLALGLDAEAHKISRGYTAAERTYAELQGKFEELLGMISAGILEDPDDSWLTLDAAAVHMALGDYNKACHYFDRSWQQREGESEWLRFDTWVLSYFTTCLAKTGDTERAGQMLGYARQRVDMQKEQGLHISVYWFDEYMLLLAEGKTDSAINEYQQARDQGYWSVYLKLATRIISPQTLENPRFQKLWQQQTETLHGYGREFLQKVCKQNPWKDYWQPAEGSCEKVGATP